MGWSDLASLLSASPWITGGALVLLVLHGRSMNAVVASILAKMDPGDRPVTVTVQWLPVPKVHVEVGARRVRGEPLSDTTKDEPPQSR
ncbi:hypothetical protein NLX83_13065 [Allokutzneria sp. A3M-2-11 16]|uniref:hypothetical protein n=1 Tax=Allokutzneria sp. A3M-2-11 16 TaxID=2962043 RepID=UPI0020B874FC|nr:hypothetical protein [Allokutzneria sp. A3M-2-11 16]MCP3800189.1 hypothetical protein [Allokutzneria sp. A3M-2-11 16]